VIYRLHAVVAEGQFERARGNANHPYATIETDHATLTALVYDGPLAVEA
jgi:hypothetical protein